MQTERLQSCDPRLKLSPKHTTIDLEISFVRGTMTDPVPPRILSHSQLHLSIDSYVIYATDGLLFKKKLEGLQVRCEHPQTCPLH